MAKADERGFDQFERFLDEWSRRDFLRRSGGALAMTAFLAGGVEAMVAACGPGTGKQPTSDKVVRGGHLTEGATSDPTTFSGVFSQDTASSTPLGMMFEPLLTQKADGTPTPAVAKSVPKPSTDGLTYKFELRQDVKWSDGHDLTADDVVFYYQIQYDPKYADLVNAPRASDLKEYVESITAPDKYTVLMKLKKVYAPWIENYCVEATPLPKHILQDVVDKSPKDFRNAAFNTAPTVTSGPFTFGRWDKDAQIVLNANSKYYLGRPNLDQYVIKRVADTLAVANQLKTGELDVGGIDPGLWDDMATVNNINRKKFQGPGWEWYGYQVDPNNPKGRPSGKIFNDKAVRQALFMALDRQKLADKVYYKQAVPATSILPATSWALTVDLPKYSYDPSKAKQMLDGAGWAVGSDGIRAKGGQRFTFEIITNQGNKVREAVVQVLSEQWKQIGVDCRVKLITFSEYTKTRQTLDFDMVMGGITYGVDPAEINSMYQSKFVGKSANRMGYRNPQVDDLLDKAVATTDRAKRKDLYVQVQKIVMEDMPVGPLVTGQSLWGISKRVQGFTPGPFNRYQSRPFLKDVWVSDAK
jgi:peptide/nickel transport system substrate-binding protein